MSSQEIDTTYSDLLLMIGGQFLFLYVVAMIAIFGVKSISDPLRTLTGTIGTSLPSIRAHK